MDEAERINGWPRPDIWTIRRKDTPKRKAYRPPPLEPGPGVRVQYVYEFKAPGQ